MLGLKLGVVKQGKLPLSVIMCPINFTKHVAASLTWSRFSFSCHKRLEIKTILTLAVCLMNDNLKRSPRPQSAPGFANPLPSFFPARTAAFRNAGILGVPNASGPMSDVEGRKRPADRENFDS